jgi:hypothetical protein
LPRSRARFQRVVARPDEARVEGDACLAQPVAIAAKALPLQNVALRPQT